jgi:hypothetical protein
VVVDDSAISSDASRAKTMGATFDLPCLVIWLGSCTTNAEALPYE